MANGLGHLSLPAFAALVQSATAMVPATGRFGDRKVFVSALHVALGGERALPALAFKSRLFQAMQAGKLELARADLVAAMDPQLVAASEIDLGGGVTYHFVVTAGTHRNECRSRPQLAVA